MQVKFGPVEVHFKTVILVTSENEQGIGCTVGEVVRVGHRNALRIFQGSVSGIGLEGHRSHRDGIVSTAGVDQGYRRSIVGENVIITSPRVDGDKFNPAEVDEIAGIDIPGMESEKPGPCSTRTKGSRIDAIGLFGANNEQLITTNAATGIVDGDPGGVLPTQVQDVEFGQVGRFLGTRALVVEGQVPREGTGRQKGAAHRDGPVRTTRHHDVPLVPACNDGNLENPEQVLHHRVTPEPVKTVGNSNLWIILPGCLTKFAFGRKGTDGSSRQEPSLQQRRINP